MPRLGRLRRLEVRGDRHRRQQRHRLPHRVAELGGLLPPAGAPGVAGGVAAGAGREGGGPQVGTTQGGRRSHAAHAKVGGKRITAHAARMEPRPSRHMER